MKTEQPILITSIQAAADITKNLFVNFAGNICGDSEKALGVANADADTGEQLPVIAKGIALVYAGDTFAVGAPIRSDSNGKAFEAAQLTFSIPAGGTTVTSDAAQPILEVLGSVTPQAINGYALDESTSADQLVRILLI